MTDHSHAQHDYVARNTALRRNERKTLLVMLLTLVMMAIELTFGYLTGSMALLADGWHMLSHAGALFIAYGAYKLARAPAFASQFTFGAGKFIPLGGYTSAIVLAIIALLMGVESIERLIAPQAIDFDDAIKVTLAGLVVNLASAVILGHHGGLPPATSGHDHDHSPHHDHASHAHGHHHGHSDHNIRGAYFHVLSDALTSVLALGALLAGKHYGLVSLDPLTGLIGAAVILRWSVTLTKETAWELLDGHSKEIPIDAVRRSLEDADTKVIDLHVWKIAPHTHACEVILASRSNDTEHYRERIEREFPITHLTIEVRPSK